MIKKNSQHFTRVYTDCVTEFLGFVWNGSQTLFSPSKYFLCKILKKVRPTEFFLKTFFN